MQIQAQVSSRILSKVDRMFSNSMTQVFVELLQNARRAGATKVFVDTAAIDDKNTSIKFQDNGTGVEDFSKLLHLGNSGWDEQVETREDPAGIGMFALAHTGVTVESRGQKAVITKAAFLGKEPVEITAGDRGPVGTALTFTRNESYGSVEFALRQVSTYGPIDVMLNGEVLPRNNFLDGAIYVKEVKGVRIGVFAGDRYAGYSSNPNMNFYGHRIDCGGLTASDAAILVVDGKGEADRQFLNVKLDVLSTSQLKLVLPDRNAVVRDKGWEDILVEVRRAVFECVAAAKYHDCPFNIYRAARDMGIDIKESTPFLMPFFVPVRDSGGSSNEPASGGRSTKAIVDPAKCVLVEIDNDCDNPSARTFERAVLDKTLSNNLVPVSPDSSYAGYQWYDSMACCSDFLLFVDGKPVDDASLNSTLNLVDKIVLTFDLHSGGKVLPIEWEVEFAGWHEEDGGDDVTLVITKTSAWVTPGCSDEKFGLVAEGAYLGFDYYEDGDTWDSQSDEYCARIRRDILKVLGGQLALLKDLLQEALGWDLTQALNSAGLSEVRLVRAEDGRWKAELPQAV